MSDQAQQTSQQPVEAAQPSPEEQALNAKVQAAVAAEMDRLLPIIQGMVVDELAKVPGLTAEALAAIETRFAALETKIKHWV